MAIFFPDFLCKNSVMKQNDTQPALTATGHYDLHIEDTQKSIGQFAAPGVEGYILGRSDDSSPYIPDLNLKNFGALEHGVSRRHAVLVRFNHIMHIIDLASVNGTYLNERRLRPDKPYALHDGDLLRLGSLKMTLIRIK
jgi:pSer/pThr/pTyr-binding forkhead associated (FHA) protein